MRYQGSKARLANEIIPIITKNLYGTNRLFVDLFAGGMNLVDKVDHPYKAACDINQYVIDLWRELKENGDRNIPQYVTLEDYQKAKQQVLYEGEAVFSSTELGFIGPCCSYGGGWFNGYARFNPKKNEDHVKEARSALHKQVKNFKHLSETRFYIMDYQNLEMNFDKQQIDNMVIYCDPPYSETKKYISDFDNQAFWDWVRRMCKTYKCEIYVSEYNAPPDFKCVWEKRRPDGMGTSKTGKRQKVKTEKLFIYNRK